MTTQWRRKPQQIWKPKTNYFEKLPNELIILILSDVPIRDILNFCQTSKAYHQYCNSEFLWKMLYERDFPNKELQKETYQASYIYESSITIYDNWFFSGYNKISVLFYNGDIDLEKFPNVRKLTFKDIKHQPFLSWDDLDKNIQIADQISIVSYDPINNIAIDERGNIFHLGKYIGQWKYYWNAETEHFDYGASYCYWLDPKDPRYEPDRQ